MPEGKITKEADDFEHISGRKEKPVPRSANKPVKVLHTDAFFERVLNALNDLVFIKDKEHRWVFLNDACCRFWQCRREELIGKSDYDYFPKDQADVYWRKDEEVFRTKTPNLNIEKQTILGKLHTIATMKSFYRDEQTGKQYIVGTIRDITEHFRKDMLLIESEEKFRNLADSSPNMIFINIQGKVVYVNRKCEEVIGLRREELLSPEFRFESIIAPESRDVVAVAFRKHLEGKEISPYEYSLVTRQGKKLNVIITTKLINFEGERAILGIVTDITDLKHSENKLRESQERYRNLLELAPVGIATVSTAGKVLSVNKALLDLTGYSHRALLGRHFANAPIILTQHRAGFTKLFRRVVEGKDIIPVRFRFKRKDGALRWGEAYVGSIIENHLKTGFEIIIQDITERQEYEEKLRNSELLYRTTINSMGDAIHMVDRDLRIVLCNQTAMDWSRNLGIEMEPQGKLLNQAYPFLSKRSLREYEELFRTGESVIGEGCYHIGGKQLVTETKKIPIVEKGRVNRILAVTRDITDQKKAIEALKESERQYRVLFDSVGDMIFIFDLRENCIEVNQVAVERLGYTREELLQLSRSEFFPHSENDKIKEHCSLKSKTAKRIFETAFKCKDGKIVPVEVLCKNIDYHRITAVLAVARDISERKEAEKALKESEEMLLQAQKMEAIGRLAGGVAHDFNNLLTAILGYTDILLLNTGLGENEKESIGEIKKSAERAALLTQRLLAFSRKQVLQPKILNLNTLIRNLQEMLMRIIGEDIRLITRLNPNIRNVKADPGQIENVLINLAVNARDAMPRGGTITIETANEFLAGRYCHLGHPIPTGEYVLFSVSDTGTGIDRTISRQIFEPFFTTKEKGKGTGLGLSTVYGIVNQSSGYIFLKSSPGIGTRFTIALPMFSTQECREREGEREGRPEGGNETLLVVEDEEAVRKMIASSLKTFGYRVNEAPAASEALERFRAGAIDLVITDVVMPDMSGTELVDRLRERHRKQKILFMSGYTDDAIGLRGVLEEGMHFLQKPFTPFQLAEKVRQVLDDR
jgi:two-component system cell cycle sensor histidine kinase/response regulator CckA